jgi:hypothetical protein
MKGINSKIKFIHISANIYDNSQIKLLKYVKSILFNFQAQAFRKNLNQFL